MRRYARYIRYARYVCYIRIISLCHVILLLCFLATGRTGLSYKHNENHNSPSPPLHNNIVIL